jgi:hypothetical protein
MRDTAFRSSVTARPSARDSFATAPPEAYRERENHTGGVEEVLVDKAYLLCLVIGHRYDRLRYPDSPDGYFMRCRRCRHERDDGEADDRIATGRGPR